MTDEDRLGRLQRELEQVAAERDRLAAENCRLLVAMRTLGRSGTAGLAGQDAASAPAPESVALQAAEAPVNQEFCLADKISLLRSLLRGRQDVFARLWESRRTGQAGYSPVCIHEWDPALCNKPRTRCGHCPDRDFALLPARVRAVRSNLIYVEKQGLSSSLLNRIKRLAAFQNPEFYKRQSMRLSVSLTPRVICCAEEFPNHLGIPRGCLDELGELLEAIGAKLELADERFAGTGIRATFYGQLTSAQEVAVSDLIRHDDGVLVAPSGSGKTVVGTNMIAARGVNTLVLGHRRHLLEQWRAQVANFLKVAPKTIGQVGGGKDTRTGVIDVAMLQSLVRKGQVGDLVAEYGHVIVDECHHLPAITFEQALRQVKARYVLGLTATPYRRDGYQPTILMQCGPVRHVVSQKDSGSQGLLRRRLVCRDTSFMMPPQEVETSIPDIYAALAADEARNQLILDDVLRAFKQGRSPILLTERREHLEFFISRLAGLVHHVVVLRGGMGARKRRQVAGQLASIPDHEERVLLVTGRYIGEGFDDARLDTLFLAMPVSWKGTLVQYAGRLHRLRAGKAEVIIHDCVDRSIQALVRMSQRRLRGYRSMGYELDNLDAREKTGAGFLL